jgi:CBS domain-containing protein
MDSDAPTCRPDDRLETVATALHDRNASPIAGVDDDGRLIGVVSRGDLVRAIVGGVAE